MRQFPEILMRVTRRVGNSADEALVHTASVPVTIGLILIGFWIGAELAGITSPLLDGVRKFTQLGILGLSAFIGIRFTDEIFHVVASKNSSFQPVRPIVSAGIKIVAGLVVLLVGLEFVGVSTLPLSALISIITLVSGLGMKSVLENFFSGMAIRGENRIITSVRIRVAEGQRILEGTVEEIGWRNIRLKTSYGSELFIPNSRILDSAVELLPSTAHEPLTKIPTEV